MGIFDTLFGGSKLEKMADCMMQRAREFESLIENNNALVTYLRTNGMNIITEHMGEGVLWSDSRCPDLLFQTHIFENPISGEKKKSFSAFGGTRFQTNIDLGAFSYSAYIKNGKVVEENYITKAPVAMDSNETSLGRELGNILAKRGLKNINV